MHIKLEYSGKWGDTIAGVRQLSAAFYIEVKWMRYRFFQLASGLSMLCVQIGKYLKEKHGLIAVPTVDQLFVVKVSA